MISHKYKCIFIHISRTAGTRIEKWLVGNDWWNIEPETKHLLASQAKKMYAAYWDDYFKFSFVRDPVARCLSCLHFKDHYKIELAGNSLDFSAYHEVFGRDVIVEHDHRFYTRADLLTSAHRKGCVYANILDEEIDFIGKYENIDNDVAALAKILGASDVFDFHALRSTQKPSVQLSDETLAHIKEIYALDYARYDYA
ncbi:sulfotransferase family 2 domain-containing protein [Solidesulfovibrio sp.]|uniref:sulfotransferase family 2 domain-containing protein n=1 Tax=Solidesulfovibrio sp. TaxID=2910990 RepID=UPI002B21859B|nr:sulfotransferase family 2 domain-containing protein [Solidesulfovibrio sp.]MEA5088054.1 sulfotransferase family 2 domain-containing protein [Solidesulfovibrio sp.]